MAAKKAVVSLTEDVIYRVCYGRQRKLEFETVVANAKREVKERVLLIYNMVKKAERKKREDLNRLTAICQ